MIEGLNKWEVKLAKKWSTDTNTRVTTSLVMQLLRATLINAIVDLRIWMEFGTEL